MTPAMVSRAWWLALTIVLAVPASAPADAQVEGASYAASGTGALAFVNRSEQTGVSSLRVVSAAGVISAPQTIVAGYQDPHVAMGARGDLIVAWTNREGLYARFQPAGGTLGPVEIIATAPEFFEGIVPVAVDGAGNAFVAYGLASGEGGLHVRMRDTSGAWGPDQTLGGERIVDPVLVASANGSALLAWRQHGGRSLNGTQIALSTRAPGQAFRPALVVAGTPRNADEPQLALNDRGDAVVTWIEQHRSTRPKAPRGETRFSIHGRFRAPGGGFGRPVQLSHISATGQTVAVAPDGRMVLAWADWTNRRVEARVRSTTGVLGRPFVLSRDLGVNAMVTALATGRGAVGWIDRDPGLVLVRVAPATKDRRFGPPQLVARVDGYDLDPVWTATPTSLAVVPSPPGRAERPIRWQRVTLSP